MRQNPDNAVQELINEAANCPDWDENKVKQLSSLIRVWKDIQLYHSPSTHPLEIAAALEKASAEIKHEFFSTLNPIAKLILSRKYNCK